MSGGNSLQTQMKGESSWQDKNDRGKVSMTKMASIWSIEKAPNSGDNLEEARKSANNELDASDTAASYVDKHETREREMCT